MRDELESMILVRHVALQILISVSQLLESAQLVLTSRSTAKRPFQNIYGCLIQVSAWVSTYVDPAVSDSPILTQFLASRKK